MGWDEDSGICWQSLWEAEGVPLGCDSDSVHSAATQPCIKSNKNSTLTAPPLMNLSSIPVFCHRCYFCVALSGVCNTRSNRRENKDTCSKEDYLNHILGEISPAYVYAAYHVTQKCQEFHRIHQVCVRRPFEDEDVIFLQDFQVKRFPLPAQTVTLLSRCSECKDKKMVKSPTVCSYQCTEHVRSIYFWNHFLDSLLFLFNFYIICRIVF